MKVAVIGNGSIGRRHLKGIVEGKQKFGIDSVSGFDTNLEIRKLVSNEIPGVEVCETMEQTVKGADVVFMCAPTSLHMPLYNEISAMGKFHFFFEKPLSHTIADCENMIFSQKRAGKLAAVGYMLHFHPVLKRAKELIDDNSIGRVLNARVEAGFYLPKWHPWEDYRDFYMSWKTGGGGALLDISHEINYMQWMFGDVVEVQGIVDTVSDLEISSDDLTVGIMKFRNGTVGQFHLDLLQFEESRYMKAIGTEGVLVADIMNNVVKVSTKENEAWKEESIEANYSDIYGAEYENLFKAVKGDGGYIVTAQEAYDTMQVIEGVRRSNAYGTAVKLPLYD